MASAENFAEKVSSTEMMKAAREGNLQKVEAITKKYGLSHRPEWLDGYAILDEALSPYFGHPRIAEFLIRAGAKLSKSEEKIDILCKAVSSHKLRSAPIVKLLLTKGASVNARNAEGDSPLHCVKLLGIARLLFTFDANSPPDVNALNSNGLTPLHVAAMRAHTCIIHFLLQKGADVNRQSCAEDGCNTPLHAAAQFSLSSQSTRASGALLRAGADVNARNASGETALHLTVVHHRCSAYPTEDLVSRPAVDIDARDNQGRTALARAADQLLIIPLEALLMYGADVNVPNNQGLTPVQIVELKRSKATGSDCMRSSYRTLLRVSMALRSHIAKLKCADLHVSEDNLLACQCTRYENEKHLSRRQTIRYTLEDPDFVKRCTDEVEKMKNERIGDSCISYYDLLSRSRRQVANYTRRNVVLRGMGSEHSIAEKFPLYGRWIAVRYRRTKRRAKLQDAALASLAAIFEFLPGLCIDRITDFLSNDDLMKCCDSRPALAL